MVEKNFEDLIYYVAKQVIDVKRLQKYIWTWLVSDLFHDISIHLKKSWKSLQSVPKSIYVLWDILAFEALQKIFARCTKLFSTILGARGEGV